MKTTLFILTIGLAAHGSIVAQSPDVIRIKGGAGGEKAVPIAGRYRYDQFRAGQILYVNGATATARLNYNILLGEMQFISSRGDTLALADEVTLRLISISSPALAGTPPDRSASEDVFVYDQKKGYLELIGDYNGIKLAAKQGLRMAKSEKQGGYGQSTGSSAITTYQFYAPGSTSVSQLDGQGDLLLIKDKNYYLIDQNSRSYLINKASLLKVYGKHREQVTTYLDNESVDFRRQKDLEKLLKYCSELL